MSNIRHPVHAEVCIPTEETWKDIPAYEGYYMVSTRGRVRSMTRIVDSRPGIKRTEKGKIRTLHKDKKGRMAAKLNKKEAKPKLYKVHRLVLLAFVGPCPEGMECRHLNGIPWDNRLENLAWGTHIDNCADRDRHGTTARGNTSGMAKLTEDQVRKIHHLYATGDYTYEDLSKLFDISAPSIGNIVRAKGFKHLGLPALVPDRPSGHSIKNHGSAHGNAKLTEDKVRQARVDFASGQFSYAKLAERYGVCGDVLRNAIIGKSWKHVK